VVAGDDHDPPRRKLGDVRKPLGEREHLVEVRLQPELGEIAGEQHQIRPDVLLLLELLEVVPEPVEQAAGRAGPLEAVVRAELQVGQVQQGDAGFVGHGVEVASSGPKLSR